MIYGFAESQIIKAIKENEVGRKVEDISRDFLDLPKILPS